jgi:hypothetical protein
VTFRAALARHLEAAELAVVVLRLDYTPIRQP